jgi:hypothetical protein
MSVVVRRMRALRFSGWPTAYDLAWMMALLKVVRTTIGALSLDEYVAVAEYAGVVAELADHV